MPTPQKQKLVEQYQSNLSEAKTVVFTNYQGLTHAQLEELRALIRQAGGGYLVTKNTLLRLALNRALPTLNPDSQKQLADTLRGPTAVLFSFEDEVSALKALSNFIETHQKPTIKAGLLNQEVIDKDKIIELSRLPSFKELIAQLSLKLNTPTVALAQRLNTPIQRLVLTLKVLEQRDT